MPSQRLIADVAGEVLPSGRMAYPVVVVLMPRRGGKTGLTLPTVVQRAAWIPRGRCWYTAQTGKDAGQTFRSEWVERAARLGPASVKARLSNGSESLTIPRSRGSVGVFAPGPRSLHGQDADVAVVDEAWAFSDVEGSELEVAIRPAMLTRPRRQLWIISAGGNADSTWLLRWRELGRALTGPDQGVAYFEWHPPVDELGRPVGDLDDPALWADTHPAVGHTIDLDTLREDRKTFGAAEFYRSYLNVFQQGRSDRVLPVIAWDACGPQLGEAVPGIEPGYGLTLSYDVAPDRSAASVSVAKRHPDGRLDVEVVDERPGTGWVADRVDELRLAWRPRLVADSVGPAVTVTRELADRGVDVHQLGTAEVVTACAELLDDVLRHKLRHRGQGPLDDAADIAAKREVGDGWAWTRKGSSGNVTPLVSVTLAAYAARHAVATAPTIVTAA